MSDKILAALALASAAFASVPVAMTPQPANAQARRRVGRRTGFYPRRRTGPFWELVTGSSFADGRARGTLAGGVTYEFPWGGYTSETRFGVHAQGAFNFGQNRWDQTDHQVTAQGVLFARNPMIGEIGLVGGFTKFSDSYKEPVTYIGGEAEYYFQRVTFGGAVGAQMRDGQSDMVVQGGVSVYPTDNLKFTLSALYVGESKRGAASFGVEYQPPNGFFYIPGTETVLFAKGTFSHQAASLRAGMRLRWGDPSSSLIYSDRYHRKNFYGSVLGSEGISPVDALPFK